jgi:hypothetical protein
MGRDWWRGACQVLKEFESVSDIFLMTVESTTYEPVAGYTLAGTAPNDLWQIGEWIADASDDSISRPGESVKLEPRTMRLLMC